MLFKGWFAEIDRFNQDELYKIGALGVLIEAIIEPLPTIIPSKIKADLIDSLRTYFQSSLEKVHLSTLEENLTFFQSAEEGNSPAAQLYQQFLEFQFPQFLLEPALQWEHIVDRSVVEGIE